MSRVILIIFELELDYFGKNWASFSKFPTKKGSCTLWFSSRGCKWVDYICWWRIDCSWSSKFFLLIKTDNWTHDRHFLVTVNNLIKSSFNIFIKNKFFLISEFLSWFREKIMDRNCPGNHSRKPKFRNFWIPSIIYDFVILNHNIITFLIMHNFLII